MDLRRRNSKKPVILVFATLIFAMQAMLLFVGGTSSSRPSRPVARKAAPALAPAPVKQTRPSQPLPIDETRYGEEVRWLVDREVQKPPEWRVLLLEKTFRKPSNTLSKVSACLVGVLGLATVLVRQKAQHARDHFFSVVAAETQWSDAVRKAQLLQGRGLVVRVVPGTSRSGDQQDARRGSLEGSRELHRVEGR